MRNEKMTVHKALAELKTMDDRITKAMRETTYVLAAKSSAEKIDGMTVADFKSKMKSNFQKVNDLIARRDAMKRAVVLSNASTKIMVGNVEYTVAEAIEMKNHGVDYKRAMLRNITMAYNAAQSEFNRNSGEALEKRAEQYVLSVIQAQPKDGKMAIDSDAMKAVRQTYIDNNSYDIIDPLNVAKIMEELEVIRAEAKEKLEA